MLPSVNDEPRASLPQSVAPGASTARITLTEGQCPTVSSCLWAQVGAWTTFFLSWAHLASMVAVWALALALVATHTQLPPAGAASSCPSHCDGLLACRIAVIEAEEGIFLSLEWAPEQSDKGLRESAQGVTPGLQLYSLFPGTTCTVGACVLKDVLTTRMCSSNAPCIAAAKQCKCTVLLPGRIHG